MSSEQDKVKAAMASHAKIVVGDEKKRQDECMNEIQRVLGNYDCILVPTMIARPGGIEFFIETRAKPRDHRKAPKGGRPHARKGMPKKEGRKKA